MVLTRDSDAVAVNLSATVVYRLDRGGGVQEGSLGRPVTGDSVPYPRGSPRGHPSIPTAQWLASPTLSDPGHQARRSCQHFTILPVSHAPSFLPHCIPQQWIAMSNPHWRGGELGSMSERRGVQECSDFPGGQWLRIHLPMQGTPVQSLVREDPTCPRATKPMSHSYWAHAP